MKAIEEQIRQAIQEGKFDNLPGKGKPLRLEENPHEDETWRMAFHILREAGFSLPWIEAQRELDAEIEQTRATLRRSYAWRCTALAQDQPQESVEAEWQRVVGEFSSQISQLNQRIRNYNLQTPSERFQRPLLRLERELERLTDQQSTIPLE